MQQAFHSSILEMCPISHFSTRVYAMSANGVDDPAGALVDRVLGSSAREYFRSSARRFPLSVNDDCFYSISCAGGFAVLAVAKHPVGIDIEPLLVRGEFDDFRWALTDSECREVSREGAERLTEIWTAKEAAAKALGSGLQASPRRFASALYSGSGVDRVVDCLLPERSALVVTRSYRLERGIVCVGWPVLDIAV